MATWTRRIRRFLLNNGAASPSRPCAGKYGKTSKPPRFTNLGQEPKGFLAKVRDAIRMATWTRRIRRILLNNGAASPSRPCAGKYGKTSKPPRFTNLGQEPT